jgi:F-type H+-transporting ATPase subunit b
MHFDASFFVAVAFVIFLVLVWKPLKKALLGALDERSAKIAKDLEDARRLREEAQKLLADYRLKHKNAMKEAAEIVDQAKAESDRAAKHAAQELDEALKRRTERAVAKIAKAEAQAVQEVRDAAIEAAVAAARELISSKLDAGTRGKLVDGAIADMAKRLN